MIRLVLLGHDASRTGAPRVLLNFINWLAREDVAQFKLLLGKGGALLPDYQRSAETLVIRSGVLGALAPQIVSRRAVSKLLEQEFFRECDLLLINTVANYELVKAFSPIKCRKVCFIHELQHGIEQYCGESRFREMKHHIDFFLAASLAVKNVLVNRHDIDPDRVRVTYEFIDIDHVEKSASIDDRLMSLPFDEEHFVVGGAGTFEFRKGIDLFLEVARLTVFRKEASHCRFVWVGGDLRSREFLRIHEKLNSLGLRDRVFFTGSLENPWQVFRSFDVFALTSREDPFPLVVLEAAVLGVPSLCFGEAGGIKEFVECSAGVTIDRVDTSEMAAEILNLMQDSGLRERLGSEARRRVFSSHSIDVGASAVWRSLLGRL